MSNKPLALIALVMTALTLTAFGDGPIIFNLEKAVRTAVLNNPGLAREQGRIMEAEGKLQEVRTGWNSSVTFDGSYTRLDPTVEFNAGGRMVQIVAPNNWDLKLTFQQLITDFGKIGKQEEALRFNLESMKEEYLAVRDDVIFRTKEAYYNILKAAGFVDVAKENLEIAEANSKIARDLFEAGAAAKFDVLRTEVSLEQARQGIIIAQNNLALAKKAFATVLNIDINTPFEVEWLKEIPCADLKLADGEKKSLADRPELRQLGMIVEMGKTLVEAARRGKNPTISLLSTYDKKNQSGFSSQDYQWTTSLALNVPIFDQGVTAARVKQAAGSLEQMQGTYDNARRQVILEVHQAWTQQAEAFQRIGVARKQVESAEEACRVGELRYREGVSIITEVLDTQAALVAARISYINSLHDYALNLAKWEQATGSTRYFK